MKFWVSIYPTIKRKKVSLEAKIIEMFYLRNNYSYPVKLIFNQTVKLKQILNALAVGKKSEIFKFKRFQNLG